MKRLALILFLCLCAPAGASEGNLTQTTGVTDAVKLDGADSVVVSSDGAHVYAAAYESDSIVAYSRNASTGALTQIDCSMETPGLTGCEDAFAIDYVDGLEISPDGEWLYAAGQFSDAVVVYDRNPADGTITWASCVSEDGAGACEDGYALDNAVGIAATNDHVYVVSTNSDSIATFTRDDATGALTETACISETGGVPCANGRGLDGPYPGVLLTADGENVYVPSHNGDAVAILDRDTGTGALSARADTTGCVSFDTENNPECTHVPAFDRPNYIVEDPGGGNLYVVSSVSSSLTTLNRAGDGDLTHAGCVSEDGSGGDCVDGRGLGGALGVGISADGTSVYALAGSGNAISIFDRAVGGALTQKPGTAGCIEESGDGITCTDGSGLVTPRGRMEVSPDGKHVYVASSLSDGIAVFSRTPNGRPVCAPLAGGNFKHDAVLTFTLGCSDPDGDPFTFEIAAAPAHGTLSAITQATGKVSFTPTAGYVGPDSFTYRASDAGGQGDAALVTFNYVNQAPVCTDSTATVAANGTVTVPINCTDGDGDALTLSVGAGPSAGTLGAPNSVTKTVAYTAAGAGGTVTFAIAATDPTGAAATQTVTVTVDPPPPPAATPTPTPSPTPTPTPSAPVTVPVTQVATLPSPKKCVSRRKFRIRLRNVKGNRIVRAEIKIGKKTVRRVSGRALSLPIDLRGLPKGRWTVQIITTDSAGKRVVGKRTYRTCVAKKK